MPIRDLIKTSMKYPLSNKNKLLKFGLIVTILSIFTTTINYLVLTTIYHVNYEELAVSTNVTSINEVSNLIFTQIPTNTWIIITILAIISIIISFYTAGYNQNVINKALNKENNLPNFNNVISKLINGLKIYIVYIIYTIIPTILIITGLLFSKQTSSILLIIGVILMIYALLLYIIAVAHMTKNNNKLSYAFKLKEINSIIKDISWLRYIGAIVIIGIIFLIITLTATLIISLIGSGLAVITHKMIIALIVNIILTGLFIESYLEIFVAYSIGLLYNEKISNIYDVDEEYLI